MWDLNNSSQKLNLKYESPASHPWVTRLLRSRAIESPASRWKLRVPREAKLSRDDRPLLYHGLAISNTCSHAKNRNDPIPITWTKVALHEDAFFAVAILGGGWLQSPASDGPPWYDLICIWHNWCVIHMEHRIWIFSTHLTHYLKMQIALQVETSTTRESYAVKISVEICSCIKFRGLKTTYMYLQSNNFRWKMSSVLRPTLQ